MKGENKIGPIIIYYGCRNKNEFIYEDEINQYKKEGVLKNIYIAFSRES